MNNMSAIRVLLIDDNPKFLAAAAYFLATIPRVEVVGCGLSGREGMEQASRLQPDLILMDVAMPEMNGLEATRRIKAQPDAPYIVILTMHDDPEYRAAAKMVGADGFITKSEFGIELLPVIHTLFNPPILSVVVK
jgi:DNA-binding NarL/FixJ family response regulator